MINASVCQVVMKSFIRVQIVLCLSIFSNSIVAQEIDKTGNQILSEEEKSGISTEIDSLVNRIIDGYNSGDIDLAFQFYDESPGFSYIGMDGLITSMTTLKETTSELYRQQFSSYKMDITERETGENLLFENAIAAFFWKKSNNTWKIIFQTESGLPPKQL
jgi:hypothetical protein